MATESSNPPISSCCIYLFIEISLSCVCLLLPKHELSLFLSATLVLIPTLAHFSFLLTLINLKAVILTTRAYTWMLTEWVSERGTYIEKRSEVAIYWTSQTAIFLSITFIASWLLYGEFYDSSHLYLIPPLFSFHFFFYSSIYLTFFTI